MKRIAPLLLAFVICSCSFSQWGKDLAGGAMSSVNQSADTLTANLVKGVTSDSSRMRIQKMLDSIIAEAGRTTTQQTVALRDSLLGAYTRQWIASVKNDLLGDSTMKQIGAIRDEALGAKTRALITAIVNNARNGLVGDSMRANVARLRDELLGPATSSAIDSIVASAVATLSTEYANKLKPQVQQQVSGIAKYATEILWTAGAVIAVLLTLGWFLFRRNKQHQQLVEVLTNQIAQLGDRNPQEYELVKSQVSNQTQKLKLDLRLNQILAAKGLLGKHTAGAAGKNTDDKPS
ncbi:MAG TPA: hypothetical protein VFJ29_00860 [Candidatus Kapabacteria bacterium]|nr:hypothetical protein [Candidatus Kapabacteria bacterium]